MASCKKCWFRAPCSLPHCKMPTCDCECIVNGFFSRYAYGPLTVKCDSVFQSFEICWVHIILKAGAKTLSTVSGLLPSGTYRLC